MNVSQKCQYGLRAVFELARRADEGPVSIQEIASAQAIPPRFLEQILAQLRAAGFLESRRGVQGGYMLACNPEHLAVGEVIRLFEGPLDPVRCVVGRGENCPLLGKCVFLPMWQRASQAMSDVYDSTTFADLVKQQELSEADAACTYCI